MTVPLLLPPDLQDLTLTLLLPPQANPKYFTNYYEPYVKQVYQHYAQPSNPGITINTQSQFGQRTARVANNALSFGSNTESFSPPSTADIFSCSTGPFATGSDAERNAIIPRLAAAFNRSTLLDSTQAPASPTLFYKASITNHYSRVVHGANADGRGYAFPYDDVQPDGGVDQSGKVNSGDPVLFTIAVGGGGVSLPGKLGESAAQAPVHEELKREEATPAPAQTQQAQPAAARKDKKGGLGGLWRRFSKRIG